MHPPGVVAVVGEKLKHTDETFAAFERDLFTPVRTEHMFFEGERILTVREMHDLPVTIRLLDPALHESSFSPLAPTT